MPVYKYNNNIIKVNGGVGGNANCCCGPIIYGCTCEETASAHCSEITWFLNNFWVRRPGPNPGVDPDVGVQCSITDTLKFPNLGLAAPAPKNFFLPDGSTITITRWPTSNCVPCTDADMLNIAFALLMYVTLSEPIYCFDPIQFPNQGTNFFYFGGYIENRTKCTETCDFTGTGDVSGTFDLPTFGNLPCAGDGQVVTKGLTWTITYVGQGNLELCPIDIF